MKMVIAYIQSHMGEKVMHALQSIPEVPGATLIEVRGFGRGRGKGEASALATPITEWGTLRKLRVETMVADELVDKVVKAIRDAGYTGHYGDGKVYVTSIESALRIRTAEEGEAAL